MALKWPFCVLMCRKETAHSHMLDLGFSALI